MEFYTELNKPPITATPSGTKLIDKYEIKIKDNKKQLVKAGKRDIYQLKQENLEETKIYNILKRHEMGDNTALNARKGVFIDLTQMPSSLMEMENAIITANNEFEKLSIEERAKYNHNWREWLSNIIEQKRPKEPEKSYIDTITPNTQNPITQTGSITQTTTGGEE